MKPLLLGLQHAHGSSGPALEPSRGSGRRLHQLSGLPLEDYLAASDRANLSDHPDLTDREVVVVLGRVAWHQLGLPRRDWFTSHHRDGTRFTLMPHPSGLCRVYNDPTARDVARITLQALLTD
jgi:hypothetical protein